MLKSHPITYLHPCRLEHSATAGRKRKRGRFVEMPLDSNPLPNRGNSRHLEPSRSAPQTPRKRRARWWNTLSRKWLTSRALSELDRRVPIERRRERASSTALWSIEDESISLDAQTLAQNGGPDLSDLRNYRAPRRQVDPHNFSFVGALTSTRSNESSSNLHTLDPLVASPTSKDHRRSIYDRNFEQKLEDCGILSIMEESRPSNLKSVVQGIDRRRRSLSEPTFTDSQFLDLCAGGLAKPGEGLSTLLTKTVLDDADFESVSITDLPLDNMRNLFPIGSGVSKTGVLCESQYERLKRLDLEDANQESTKPVFEGWLLAPNMTVLFEEQNSTTASLERQACYIGALGAQTMHQLRSRDKVATSYDEEAHTFSATYIESTLSLYCHHVASSTRPEWPAAYHTTLLGSWKIDESRESFVNGVTAVRNARDWAATECEASIKNANQPTPKTPTDQSRGRLPGRHGHESGHSQEGTSTPQGLPRRTKHKPTTTR